MEGVAALLGSEIGSRYRGVSQLQSHQSRYSVQLSPSGHGRPRRKSWMSAPKSVFSCGPGGGEKLFDPWSSESGMTARNPDQKIYLGVK